MSNYLLAFGKTEHLEKIRNIFYVEKRDYSEIKTLEAENGFSMLSVSKSEVVEKQEDDLTFFRGWFQDHNSKSIVLGQTGFNEWWKHGKNKSFSTEYEGCYLFANYNNSKLIVRNDLFSYLPVVHFETKELFVCSDSLYILSEVRKGLGLPCKLNQNVMHSRAWTHGLACAVMSNDTQIEGVRLLSPGKHIEVCLNKTKPSSEYLLETKNIVKSTNLKAMFSVEFDNYKDAIRDAATKMAQSTMSMLYLDDVMINFGLSGGLDSRIILAAVLQKPELFEKIAVKTNPHPSRKGDFDIVEKLANKFNFKFNEDEKLSSHKRKHSLRTVKIKDKFSLWILSSMGLFDMMYLHDAYWPKPHIIEMGGHGAETVKGTFAGTQFSDYIYKPTYLGSALRMFKDIRQIRFQRKCRAMIERQIRGGLQSSGIDLYSPGPMQWHYLSYKSPIANGRFLDRSSIGIRPFIQHSLFALSVSEINPFKQAKKGDPTMLHDMLIILNPELAAIDFENKKSNISEDYIQSRLELLGGVLQLSESQPYAVFGKISDMENGPPMAFLNKINFRFEEDENVMARTLKTLESVWSSIEDDAIRKVYQSAYDTAKERLTDPDYYPPSAGTPAAKIISHILFD